MEPTDDSKVGRVRNSTPTQQFASPSKWYDWGVVTLTAFAGLLSGITLLLAYLGVVSIQPLLLLGALLLFAAAAIYWLVRARKARQANILERWNQEHESALSHLQEQLATSKQARTQLQQELAQQRAVQSEHQARLEQFEQTQSPTRVPLIFGWQALGLTEAEIAPQLAILAELFHDHEQIHIQKKFSSGHRNRGVYQVRSSNEVERIVKIARSSDIRAERRAQELINRFSQSNGGRYVRDTQRAEEDAYGGIVYQLPLLRRNSNLMNFDSFYRKAPGLAACGGVMEQLYSEALPHCAFRWHEAAPLFQEHALSEPALKKITAMIWENVTLTEGALHDNAVRVLFGGDSVAVPNPLVWAEKSLPRFVEVKIPALRGVIHGDLHSGNLLIEEPSLNVWLIDFAKTRDHAHTLTDFARMEADLKFYLLPSTAENYFTQALTFEQTLLAPNEPRDLEIAFQNFEPFDAEFQKAAACILALRRAAVQQRRAEDDEHVGHFAGTSTLPYYLALWQATLRTLKYEQCNRDQKTYAFISAGMLCERIHQLST